VTATRAPVEIALGLGSNIGDKVGHLRHAVALLEDSGTVRRPVLSSIYRTAPWGPVEQDWFANACLWGFTDLSPEALLGRVKAFEQQLGRTATVRWGPRVIDIDILYYDGTARDTPDLVLPHRELTRRAFVLVPLAEIRPAQRIAGATVAEWASRLDVSDVVRIEPAAPP
jgi:2-amino-4-hydroxy-6-hydroxymethyldihydropteridine diphosphokinase